ncbi:hypothetical protein A6X21_20800 [Planctopirus hydrillae]|uniref:Uncharacterized protein n=1 Tax=Planctopirus hydrillae TaxID=1841610 RepID=A0A1C3EHT2_9PLAN|nr:hypothetical protein A6X21_20800 [Planctopirus hydrillae]
MDVPQGGDGCSLSALIERVNRSRSCSTYCGQKQIELPVIPTRTRVDLSFEEDLQQFPRTAFDGC